MLSKRDKEMEMTDAVFARDLMREAFPKGRHGSVYSAQYAAFDYLRRTVRKNMTFRRARSIWEGAAKRIDAEEAEALKRAKIEESRRELQDLRKRLSELDAELASMGTDEAGAPGTPLRRSTDF